MHFKLRVRILPVLILLMLFISSCVKPLDNYTDLSKVNDFVILTNAGLQNFSTNNFVVTTDVVHLTVTADLASANNNNSPITVTVMPDLDKIASYNNANGTNYVALPADAFTILNNGKITIPAGQHYGTVTIEVYKAKVTPGVDYMLPVSISDASGKLLSSNQNTVYFNIIGNLLAGPYDRVYTRWNNSTGTGTPTTTNTALVNGLPDDKYTLEFQSGYGDQNGFNVRYVLAFTVTNGVAGNFSLTLNPNDVANNLNASSIQVTSPPTIITADGVNKHFKFTYGVVNGSGSPRTFTDEYTIH